MGVYQSVMKRFGNTRAFAQIGKRMFPPVDRMLYRVTGGKRTLAGTVVPTFLVIHKGRKTGRELKTPLSYIRNGNGFALAGSNFGQAHHPAWSANLMANPEIEVILDGETIPVRARLATADERPALWEKFVAMWPAYNTYDTRSADRNIRVFVLDRR